MTTTYDPRHPKYYDEADLREELTRVYDLCHGCRLCFNLCPSFPSMFDAIDRHDGDVEALSVAEQDKVVDECFQCKICYVKCPYVPPHEWELDFPRLMLRATASKRKREGGSITDHALGRTDLVGTLASVAAPLANATVTKPGSLVRKAMERVTGISAQRLLPPYAKQRFSTWFKKRAKTLGTRAARSQVDEVAVYATCLVEYQNPGVGHDLVKVLERNAVSCEITDGAQCCGMPWLDAGDIDRFTAAATKNVSVLAAHVRAGRDIVVPQPTCGYAIKRDYPHLLGTPDAQLVAEHTYDSSEYLMKLHKERKAAGGEGLDTDFTGPTPESVTWHVPCHLQAQNVGFKTRDLLKLTGARVDAVAKCAGIDGTWGLRAANYEAARKVAQPLANEIKRKEAEVVAGECHLANGAITEETGRIPMHPVQILARAYGIAPEPGVAPGEWPARNGK